LIVRIIGILPLASSRTPDRLRFSVCPLQFAGGIDGDRDREPFRATLGGTAFGHDSSPLPLLSTVARAP
jgi:hypothetical protein